MIVKEDTRLVELADEANDEHSRVVGAIDDAIYHMRQAGDALIEARGELIRLAGPAVRREPQVQTVSKLIGWRAWLRDNFSASRTTAERYMLVAEHYDELVAERARLAADGKKFNYIRTIDTIVHPEADPDEPEVEPEPVAELPAEEEDGDDEEEEQESGEVDEGETDPDEDDEDTEADVADDNTEPAHLVPFTVSGNASGESETLEDVVTEVGYEGIEDLPSPYPTHEEEAYKAIGPLAKWIHADPQAVAMTCAQEDLEAKAYSVRLIQRWVTEVADALESRIQKPLTMVYGGVDD
jgi:hypothetical protein